MTLKTEIGRNKALLTISKKLNEFIFGEKNTY